MSSIDALSVAANSLAATQQQLAIVSQNIGNAQNQNYNARNAQTESQGSDGAYVTVSVTRAVNEILQNEMLGQTTTAGGANVTNQMYSQLEALTGGNTTSPVLDQAMQQLVNAFQGYQTSPESAAAQSGVVSAAQNLVSTIQTVSTGLTNLQFQTQQNVQTDVTTLNTTLSQINGLNDQIKAQMAAGQDVGGLQDQRDALISTVATMIPVRQQVNADGTVYLSTPGGMALVDGAAAQFSYQPPPTYTPGYTSAGATTPTPNNADSAGIIYLSSDPSKTPLNASFGTGQIGSELNSLRTDTAALNSSDPSMGTIAKAQQQLSYLSEQFYDPNAGTVGGTSYGTEFQQVFGGIGSTSGDTTNAANNFTNSLFTSTDGNAATPGSLQVNPALVGANPTENISDILTQGDAANVVNFMSTGSATVTDASNGATTTINYTFPGNNGGATGVPGDISGQTIAFGNVAQLFATSEASRASQAQDASQSATTSLSTTTTSYHAQTGVSIDQQLELMVVLQNSYNAASKIIGTMSQLQQQLFNAA